MKISILVVAITLAALAALSAAGFLIYQNFFVQPEAVQEETPLAGNEENPPAEEEEEILSETELIKDDFQITLPPGWVEANTPPEGVLAMAVDAEEDVSGAVFQKLDFRTNFSVKADDMTWYKGIDDLGAYIESVKTSLIQNVPGIGFTREEQKTISGNRAILIECESTQEEVAFKTLLAFIGSSEGAVYAISFNTLQSSWASYRDSFYRIADSFKLKYKMEL